MIKDNLYTTTLGRDKLLSGIDKACKAVALSYGPSGSNALLGEDMYPFHSITNDGRSIVEKIKLTDPVEQMGVDIIKEIGDKAEKDSGDGRKTTMIIANTLMNEGKKIEGNPMDIKRSLDDALPYIIESLNAQKKNITANKIGRVAIVATENEKIGYLLQDIYTEIGKNGIVEIENSGLSETFYELKDGVRFRNAGYIAPYMANSGNEAIYENPCILITKQKIGTLNDINPLFEKLVKKNITSLVIYCEDIDMSVLSLLARTHIQGAFKTLIIKAPKLWKDWFYEDFAKVTGATLVAPENGLSLANVGINHLGTCEKIIATPNDTMSASGETRVIGIKNIKDHIQRLKDVNTDDSKLRLAWLETKTAILKLGANSESELSYISKKARDGRNAAYLALKEGVVEGAGLALREAVKSLPNTIGGNLLRIALLQPHKQIIENGALPNISKDILDPVIVVKNAVTNAVSVAGMVLTTRMVIPIIRE